MGLPLTDRDALLEKQKHKCAICGDDKKLCIDHDHGTGKVRGLLCTDCNLSLGRFKDNIDILSKAITYLRNGK